MAASEPMTGTNGLSELETIKEEPKHYFRNANFYQDALSGVGDIAKRMHTALAQFLKADNPEDRSNYRSRLIPVYWDLAKVLAQHAYGTPAGPQEAGSSLWGAPSHDAGQGTAPDDRPGY